MHSVYVDMAAARHSSDVQLSEAIQNLPPELREMILKEYITIKIKEKKEMGWGKVHENILKLPFCELKQQIAPIICFEYPNCPFEGKCYHCLDEGNVHEMLLSREMEEIPLIEATPEYKGFLKPCSWCGYDYHELFLDDGILL